MVFCPHGRVNCNTRSPRENDMAFALSDRYGCYGRGDDFLQTHYLMVFMAAAAFAPMIQALSGNAGLQTSAVLVSGLATGHLAALRFDRGNLYVPDSAAGFMIADGKYYRRR